MFCAIQTLCILNSVHNLPVRHLLQIAATSCLAVGCLYLTDMWLHFGYYLFFTQHTAMSAFLIHLNWCRRIVVEEKMSPYTSLHLTPLIDRREITRDFESVVRKRKLFVFSRSLYYFSRQSVGVIIGNLAISSLLLQKAKVEIDTHQGFEFALIKFWLREWGHWELDAKLLHQLDLCCDNRRAGEVFLLKNLYEKCYCS